MIRPVSIAVLAMRSDQSAMCVNDIPNTGEDTVTKVSIIIINDTIMTKIIYDLSSIQSIEY